MSTSEISLVTMEMGGGEAEECVLTLEDFAPEILHVIYTHISLAIRVKCNPTL